jgi:hypothetical protein
MGDGRGRNGALKGTRKVGKGRWIAIIYREISKTDGFIMTAYFLDKKPKGEIIWGRG